MRTAAKFILIGAIGLWIISLGIYLDTHVQAPPGDFFVESDLEIEEPVASSSVLVRESLPEKKEQPLIQPSGLGESIPKAAVPVPAAPALQEESALLAGNVIAQTEIDIQTVVLVRCLFQTQYFSQSSQPWNEQEFNLGSGVIVSPSGYLVTARHIFEVRRELLNDPAGRVWRLQKCEAAITDTNQSEISSDRFQPVSIAYKPGDQQYRQSAGLDFAVLKFDSGSNFRFSPLVSRLVEMEPRSQIIAIGYPGRESASPQKLERFDGEFTSLTYFEESSCDGTVKLCGLRYAFRRYPYNFEKDFWKGTDLGIVTPYFRGGFSGGPAFFKGNLIGIVTHGQSGDETESGWDEAFILTSFDIVQSLQNVLEL